MNYDTWKTTDTVGDEQDGRDRAERQADEEARAARWNEFVAFARQASIPILLDDVAKLLRGQTDPWYAHRGIDERLSAFAETEGWDGVLNAIARAYREQAH